MMGAYCILSDIIGQERENLREISEQKRRSRFPSCLRPLAWVGKEEVVVWEEEWETKRAEQEQRATSSSARISGLRLDTSL